MQKQNILRKNHQFQSVINKKQQVVTKAIVLYYLDNEECGLRIGISISKKFAIAVKRNKYRRQIRHILDELNLWNEYKKDIVLIVRKPFLIMGHDEQKKVIKNVFERLNNEQ